jgi:hypothetical protein
MKNLFRLHLFAVWLLFMGVLQAFASPKPKPEQLTRLVLTIPVLEKNKLSPLIEVKAGEPTITLTSSRTLTITEAGTDKEATELEVTKMLPPASIYVWSGAVSKQWQDPANWLVNNIVATGIPTFGSTIGNEVQIPVVVSGNYPEITTSAGARSITIAATASLTIKSGGQIRISGTADNSVTNGGTFTNNGTVTLDSIFTDGFINQAGASLINTAAMTIGVAGRAGLGSSLKNSGSINNSGTFNVNGGVGRVFFNYPGGKVINTNAFNVQNGDIGGIYNQGKIDNAGQMSVKFGKLETLFDNLDTLINQAGATFTVSGCNKRLLDNRKYVLNEGIFNVQSSAFEGLLNRQGAKLLNKANGDFKVSNTTNTNFINAGYVENDNLFTVNSSSDTAVYNKPTGEILNNGNWIAEGIQYLTWVNLGKLTLGSTAQLNLQRSDAGSLKNDGTILTTTGCQISISSFNVGGIINEGNGVFENNCVTSFQRIGGYSISNKGRYTHLNGSVSSLDMTNFVKNENYFHLNAPIANYGYGEKVFENSDTLILGSQVANYFEGVGNIFTNSGYLYSDAQFTLLRIGQVLNNNGGKVVLGPQSVLKGFGVGNVISNSGHFTNKGVLQFTNSGPYIVNNTGTFLNKNRIKSARTEYSVYNNGGTFENSGTIEADTVRNGVILQVGSGSSFTNTTTGKVLVDMSSGGGINNNAGTFINNGELLLAQTDSLRNSAINNVATFQNNNLIRIGRSGDNGIINTGTFTNAANGNIFITATTKTLAITPAKGIDNQSGTFTNQPCATIESETKIVTSGGSFINGGTIKKTEDKVTGDSNISSNTGTINNLDANAFNVTGSNTPLVVTINSAATPICQGTTRLLTANPTGGTFSVTGPGSLAGDMLTATGGGVINVTYTYNPVPGCSFTATQAITAYSAPMAVITGTISICQNAPAASVTFTGSNGTAPYSFTYKINGGPDQTISTTGVTTSVSVTQSTAVANSFTYTLVSVSDVNCTVTSLMSSATVTVKPLPSSLLTASKVDVCPNTEVTLDAHCSIPASTINWNPGAPTITPAAATLPYVYKASCTFDGCTGNESSIEVRTQRILVDMKDLDVGTLPLPIARAVKDNMAPTNLIEAPVFPRRWTFIANGCDASESAVFKLSGPVNFMAIDNAATYALFANDAGGFYAIDHPNYGNGGSFPNGTYTLTVDLRNANGVGGPFPKNRVAAGSLLATRTIEFTVGSPSARVAADDSEGLTVDGLGLAEISPNPLSHTMRLKVYKVKGQSVEVSLMDASGRTLLQRSFVPETNHHQEEFEVSHLTNGIYFMRVNTDTKNATLKVIKAE